jgi:hypothetical protein
MLPAAAQSAGDDAPIPERLLVPIPQGWSPVSQNETEMRVTTTYAQSRDALVAVDRLLGMAGVGAEAFATNTAREMAARCDNAALSRGEGPSIDGQPSYGFAVTCPSGDGQVQIVRSLVIAGEADLHTVTRVWRGPSEDAAAPEDPATAWSAFFDDIGYCPIGGCR